MGEILGKKSAVVYCSRLLEHDLGAKMKVLVVRGPRLTKGCLSEIPCGGKDL